MRRKDCAGGIVLNPDNMILVITNQIGKHTFPKGTREPGERPEDTALREIKEESGLANIAVVKFSGTLIRPGYTADNGDKPSVEKHIDMFHCISTTVKLCPQSPDAVSAQWVPPDGLSSLLTWPEELAFFASHRNELGI